jgi:transposase
MRWVGLTRPASGFDARRDAMTIVMGLDQHRAQITAEWLDGETGELSRARVAPAHRESVRRFLERFRGRELEAALEATTGWRFMVEELRRVGAGAHLAEPAETSALRGNKKRATNDRSDARQLRELLQAGRLPEQWIVPDHILDLRARVRLRHSLVDDRGEWQQRMQAVLYLHGLPKRADLLTRENRAWVCQLPLPAAGREQIAVGLAMVDAIDLQLQPIDRDPCRYARRQPGCKALQGHYAIGALTSVTILSELGDVSRFSSSREVVRYAGMDITVKQSDRRRAPGRLSRQGPPALRWAVYEAAQAPPAPAHLTATTTGKQPSGSGATVPAWPRAQAAQTRLPVRHERWRRCRVGDIVHRRCCARDGGLLALRRRPCGGRRQTTRCCVG